MLSLQLCGRFLGGVILVGPRPVKAPGVTLGARALNFKFCITLPVWLDLYGY